MKTNNLLNKIRLDILTHINKHENDIKLDIARDTDVTFSQINKILKKELLPLGLIKPMEKQGRRVYINLTEKGKILLDYYKKIKKLLR